MVASILPYPPLGGGHKRTLRLLEAMVRAGVAPRLIVPGHQDRDAVAELGDRGIAVDCVADFEPTLRSRALQHAQRLPSPRIPAVSRRLRERLEGERPAFVQIEHIQNGSHLRALGSVPAVLSAHNVDSELIATVARAQPRPSVAWLRDWNRWQATRATERRAARAAAAVLCVSDRDAQRFAALGARTVVAPNGVDDSFFSIGPALGAAPRVLFFGQYDYEPNALGVTRFLREGWPAVARERPAASLRLVGPGMSDRLAALVRRTAGADAVGPVARLEDELEAARAVVVPIWQGGGTRLKVLESMAAARPIAGTPLGVADLGFESRAHGLVAESPGQLAKALLELLADGALSAQLAARARELASGFRWAAVTRPAERLYRELCSGTGAGATASR